MGVPSEAIEKMLSMKSRCCMEKVYAIHNEICIVETRVARFDLRQKLFSRLCCRFVLQHCDGINCSAAEGLKRSNAFLAETRRFTRLRSEPLGVLLAWWLQSVLATGTPSRALAAQ